MNKKILIIIGVVVVFGLVIYFAMMQKTAPNSDQVSNDTSLADDSDMSGEQSLRSLMMGKQAVKCQVVIENMTNDFYIADNNMRSDFGTMVDGKLTKGHMIVKGDASYTWIEGEEQGFKVVITEEDMAVNNTDEDVNQNVDFDEKMNYSCQPWKKDASYFELPNGVDFSDLSSLVPSTPPDPVMSQDNAGTEGSMNDSQCSACDSIPAENQAQCRAALGCN